jgi:secondary thiamine-phosphate synthase enzyme
VLRQACTTLAFDTRGRGLLEITRPVVAFARDSGIGEGLLTLFVRHTSASLLVQENADPVVRDDLERFFARLVPDGDALFRHRDEGPDDMPAHVRAALTAVQVAIPLSGGALPSARGKAFTFGSIACGRIGARSRRTSLASDRDASRLQPRHVDGQRVHEARPALTVGRRLGHYREGVQMRRRRVGRQIANATV